MSNIYCISRKRGSKEIHREPNHGRSTARMKPLCCKIEFLAVDPPLQRWFRHREKNVIWGFVRTFFDGERPACQNLDFAAHRRASAVKPILTCAAVRRLLCRGAGDRAGRAPGRRPKRASEPPASPRGTARPGYVNIGLTAEPCESVHPWTERGGAPSRVSVAG